MEGGIVGWKTCVSADEYDALDTCMVRRGPGRRNGQNMVGFENQRMLVEKTGGVIKRQQGGGYYNDGTDNLAVIFDERCQPIRHEPVWHSRILANVVGGSPESGIRWHRRTGMPHSRACRLTRACLAYWTFAIDEPFTLSGVIHEWTPRLGFPSNSDSMRRMTCFETASGSSL